MKKAILILLGILLYVGANAETKIKTDTVFANPTLIQKWITEPTKNEKTGKVVNKYYVIYDGRLITTSKSVVDKVILCQKYNVSCALAIVRKNKKPTKLILD